MRRRRREGGALSGSRGRGSAAGAGGKTTRNVVPPGVELNVISQDTVAYGRDQAKSERTDLATLAQRIADVKGVRWVRLFYLYPETIDEALIGETALPR